MIVDEGVGFVLSLHHYLPSFEPGIGGSNRINGKAIGRCTGCLSQDVVERREESPVLSNLESRAAVVKVECHRRCAACSVEVDVVAVGRLHVDVVAIAFQSDVERRVVVGRFCCRHLHEERVAMLIVLHILLCAVIDVASYVLRILVVGLTLDAIPARLNVVFRCDGGVLCHYT